MVSFARDFSNGQEVDCVETNGSRIILKELEPDWWIIAVRDSILHKRSTTNTLSRLTSHAYPPRLKRQANRAP